MIAGRSDHEYGKSLWELGMMKLRDERDVGSVARRYGGTMDTIAGRSAARLPNDHFIVQLAGNLLGSYTPANRQDVSRWLSTSDSGALGGLSKYLEQAFGYAARVGTPIVMAMDIGGAVSAADVKRRLDSMETISESGTSTAQLAKLISGARGITLGITVNKQSTGAIRVDFAEPPTILNKIGKDLLIEVLADQGAMIDDFQDWAPSIDGNTFLLRGSLSSGGMRRALSVLELPGSLADAMDASTDAGQSESAMRVATQDYYGSVTMLIENLRDKPKRSKVKTFGQAAMWYDRYARKIDNLPILNVDETMLDYGADISTLWRNAEMAMKGVGMRSSLRASNNRGYRSGYYSGNSYDKTSGDSAARNQERFSGAMSVQQIWQTIDELTASIRREMTAKYKVEF